LKSLFDSTVDDQIQGLQTFLSEGHTSYYTTVQGPDISRTVIVSRYVAFYRM